MSTSGIAVDFSVGEVKWVDNNQDNQIQSIPLCAGTIFRLGKQKLNDFSVGKVKMGEKNQDNQIQSIPLCNMYFSKKAYAVYNAVLCYK